MFCLLFNLRISPHLSASPSIEHSQWRQSHFRGDGNVSAEDYVKFYQDPYWDSFLFFFSLCFLATTRLFDLLNILPPQNFFRWQWWQIWSVLLSTPMAGMKQDHRQLSYKRSKNLLNLEWTTTDMFSQWWYDFLFFWHLLSYVGAAMFPRWTHYNLALSQTILSQKHTHKHTQAHTNTQTHLIFVLCVCVVALLRPCSPLPFSSPLRILWILIFSVLFIYLPMKRLNTKNLAVYPSYLPSCSDEGAWWSYRSRGFVLDGAAQRTIKKKIPKDSPSIGRGC